MANTLVFVGVSCWLWAWLRLLHPHGWRPERLILQPLHVLDELLKRIHQFPIHDFHIEKVTIDKIDAFRRFDHILKFLICKAARVGLIERGLGPRLRTRRLQHTQLRRLDVYEKRFQLGGAQRLDRLVVRTQHTHTARIHNGLDALGRGAVEVTLVLAVLHKFARLDVSLHLIACHENVLTSRHLTWSHGSRGI